ncbi:SMC domain protein [Candidatus Moduliflexus flocculans]|uniref:SMC domain protein n=1 Tax=Candidatus Moduliflexus flocculans TaxID=1499966 RepID=A0A0S6VZA6_9BACT|nr:SMC domain protein [Candidatus Moduliflexus flocculans]
MGINTCSLKNFKCFKEVDIDFSKITLLTGANSSGKSSFLYGLLSIFQSDGFPFSLSPNGKYINMGDFKEISFNNVQENLIEIDIAIDANDIKREPNIPDQGQYFFKSTWSFDPENNMPRLSYLKVSESKKWFLHFELQANEDGYRLNCELDSKSKVKDSSAAEIITRNKFFTASKAVYDAILKTFEKKFTIHIQDFALKNLGELFEWNYENPDFLNLRVLIGDFISIYSDIDKNLNFLSSFRLQPERTYYQKLQSDNTVGQLGENCIEQIVDWEMTGAEELEQLNAIFRKLKLLHAIRTKKLPGGRFELSVKVDDNGIWASLTDVGFGISQLLPLIVADLQLPENSTLLLAQPEIHLHPSVQASLTDYFVEQANIHHKRYIIETHSEYLLNRFRLAIVKKLIAPEDLSIYYFEHSIDGTITHKIEFTTDGQIKHAPQGFFDTYMMDVMDIALYA